MPKTEPPTAVAPPTQSAPPYREVTPNRWANATYVVRLRVDRLVGGIPRNPELIKGWLLGRGITGGVETLAAEEAAKLDGSAIEEGAWKGFFRDYEGIFIEPRNVRGFLKQAARAIPDGGTKTIKAALKKLTDNLVILPSRIHFERPTGPVMDPDGSEERAIHVRTPQGNRTALKRSDYVRDAEVTFSLYPSHPDLKEEWLKDLFEYGSAYLGLGSDVSQDEGKFRLLTWERTDKPKA